MQLVGHRRRDVRNLRALEWRAPGQDDFVAAGIGRGFQRQRQLHRLAGALHVDLRRTAERTRRKTVIEGIGIVDRLPVDRDDQIRRFQSSPRRRTVRDHAGDQCSGRQLEPERFGDLRRHRLQARAKPRPLDGLAAALRRSHDDAHHVGRDRKTDALRSAGAREDRGIDAGELAGHVDQRAARIARVDRSIGLNEELVVGDADLRARQRRDDAVGHGLPDAEGIADRDHDVADLQFIGIGKIERREFFAPVLQPQHGKIGAAVLEHDLGLEFALVGERNLDLIGAFDDVVVGHDQTGRIHHHPRSKRSLHLFGLLAGHAEETAEDRIVEQRIAVLHHLGGVDVDNGRLHALHDRRVGKPDFRRRGRARAGPGTLPGRRDQRNEQCRENANRNHEGIPGNVGRI